MGSLRRSAARASRARVAAFSLTSSLSRAAFHSLAETIFGSAVLVLVAMAVSPLMRITLWRVAIGSTRGRMPRWNSDRFGVFFVDVASRGRHGRGARTRSEGRAVLGEAVEMQADMGRLGRRVGERDGPVEGGARF